jgi:pseudouridine-5'-phosphate glycosidase
VQSSHQIHYREHVARIIDGISYSEEVKAAIVEGKPIVALESTIISHGLPRPQNLLVAQEVEEIVRRRGATPATIALIDGVACIGLSAKELSEIANRTDIVKASSRDLAVAVAKKMSAATTVAATAHLAAQSGIKVFATGGLGGVHRGAHETYDESADLTALSNLDMTVVCAGVKSILDVGATLERLETLAIAILGYRTRNFPGFYLTDSGFEIEHQVESAREIADILVARALLGTNSASVLVVNPVENQMNPKLHEEVLTAGLKAAAEEGISGKVVTPFLLEFFHTFSKGESLRVNIDIIKSNSALAADIAVALSRP